MPTSLRALAASAATVVAAACAVPAVTSANGETIAGPVTKDIAPAPLRCALQVRQTGGMIAIEGLVQSETPLSGSYMLDLVKTGGNSAQIQQGGGFTVAVGETARVGSAELSGSASDVSGTLTLTVDGRTMICPITG
ncbi:hypothetical protein OG2516_13434 [Oceanicola granulosus HTCC2516]|uniref:CsgH-like domain-containing protein n=1 Tax=Oceanicola granulosus (strain ATCC BAA-861 / DSM 15982 / KCTC 12143 / HTCC2516) TaxID=314256 RepID=Q2CGY1_OCEGH|nr:curli-like amyloid fiber formation chaperone CsgH [Oceanicola granulosus]EAR52030.1 hypothetical protein OG2516_13434 [Oceanicola granulosus HTCC2516]